MRLALAALLSLAACNQQPAGEPVTRAEIGGEEIAEATPSPEPTKVAESDCRQVTFEDVPLTHCVADPARHAIRAELDAPDGDPARSLAVLKDMVEAPESVAFAMNGGMFDDNGRPIGYYVEAGERLKTLNRATGPGNFHMLPNGVFFGSRGKWQVRTAEDFEKNVGERPEFGTQSGPMLVIAGKLHPEIAEDGPSRAIRNGVGIDARGRAHFVISDGPLSFGKLARFFRDELDCANALYLDGAVSALWDPASGRLDQGAPLGPLIVVEKRGEGRAMILVLDNYDSFTWNLVHYLMELGAEVEVVRNDAISAGQALSSGAQGFLISPGPCTPNEAGISLDLVAACAEAAKPLLGVCLGHQAIGQHFGGRVVRGGLMHGKTSPLTHDGSGVFEGLPSPFTATRYHSLVVEDAPECLVVNATSDDAHVMGFRHASLPIHGVQFHPESIATEHGHALLANFLRLCGIEARVPA